jgi:cation transport regulator ChaC
MLKSTPEEVEAVREYFEWQAADLEITFMQKVYSESVLNTRHDVWDIHTNKDRWWVITDPTNLYSQDQFPNMDLALTFHIGLCLRIPRTREQQMDDRHLVPFGAVFAKLDEATEAISQARSLSDYQALGVRCRETLLEFVGVAQDAAIWTESPPKRADFRAWTEIICNDVLPGDSNKERRGVLKGAFETAWTFSNWLTHAKSATWTDADMACSITQHAIGMAASIVLRGLRGVPSECPKCRSPRLEPQEGENSAAPGVLWERPHCLECGWTGRPVPIAGFDDGVSIITREGEDNDDHSIMTVPLRTILKPGDPPIQPLPQTERLKDASPLIYFAYGSNMSPARLKARTPSARVLGTATLPGHVLRFHKRSRDKSGKCNVFATANSADRVLGVLFAIDKAERSKLDGAEGLNKGYHDATVTVINEHGRRRKVLTYVATPDSIDDNLKPYTWYKDFVVSGAKECGLPTDYVSEFIEAVEAVDDPDEKRAQRERAILG